MNFNDNQSENALQLRGKKISIFGDSISTLIGYNPKGYNLFFTGGTCQKAGVRTAEDTWWGKVIGSLGGELLVNNSWSGSCVTKLPNREGLFPSGCSDERTSALHSGLQMPEIIIVYSAQMIGQTAFCRGTAANLPTVRSIGSSFLKRLIAKCLKS